MTVQLIDKVNSAEFDLASFAKSWKDRKPETILKWAFDYFGDTICVTSSFGATSGALLHLANKIKPGVPIIFLDTYYHFAETLQYKETLERLLNLNILTFRSSISREDFKLRYSPKLYSEDPDLCCHLHKVLPMKEALGNFKAWVSGIRRGQTQARQSANFVERYEEGIVKINPLLEWTTKDVFSYMKENHIPGHPLSAKGYKSIGCWPCTQRVGENEDERSGRWQGHLKTECGLHLFMRRSPETELQ
ncbi:MAG: phosphoadenylyl-sulfate reductase [Candidatus Omnitrophica bacterium]|nr:phosphoadenylyl-sulfate reductase [Candidatus Omnitrophota bacterium]